MEYRLVLVTVIPTLTDAHDINSCLVGGIALPSAGLKNSKTKLPK